MTIRFDNINGTLCLMLEKPVPLTKDAKFPCLVRLIQDDSLIGMHTSQYSGARVYNIIATGICQYGKILSDGKIFTNYTWPGSWFEIIGYPVEEGSAEYALFQIETRDKGNTHEVAATIRLKNLDPQTRQLVEKLLAAQEEK